LATGFFVTQMASNLAGSLAEHARSFRRDAKFTASFDDVRLRRHRGDQDADPGTKSERDRGDVAPAI